MRGMSVAADLIVVPETLQAAMPRIFALKF
jgi:hypothetical protein